MFLVYSNEAIHAPEEEARAIAQHHVVMRDAEAHGVLRAADPLTATPTATTVRVRRDEALITDGPFAETKEQLAGYYILDCADLDEAIAWAKRMPTACHGGEGCIEIRPIQERRKSFGDLANS